MKLFYVSGLFCLILSVCLVNAQTIPAVEQDIADVAAMAMKPASIAEQPEQEAPAGLPAIVPSVVQEPTVSKEAAVLAPAPEPVVQPAPEPVKIVELEKPKEETVVQPALEPAEIVELKKPKEGPLQPAPEPAKIVEPEKPIKVVKEPKKLVTLEIPEEASVEVIQDGHIVQIKDKENLKKIFKENQYIVMNVYAPWCGHCKRMHKPFAVATKKFEGRVIATKVNVENKALKEIAGCFDGVPGFFYIRKQMGSTGAEKSALKLTNLSFGQLVGHRMELNDSDIKNKLAKADAKFVKELKTVDEFFQILRENNHIVVKVSAAWCGACKILQKPFRIAAEMYKDKVVTCEIDGDNKVFGELLDLLGAHRLPTIFYIKKESGTCAPEHLASVIAMVTGQEPRVEEGSKIGKKIKDMRQKMDEKMKEMRKKMRDKKMMGEHKKMMQEMMSPEAVPAK